MELKELFKESTSFFNLDLKTKEEVVNFLSEKLLFNKIIKNQKQFETAIFKRENEDSTGIFGLITIPHALDKSVVIPTVGFISLKTPIIWGSLDDKPVDLIFMIATTNNGGDNHLNALSQLSQNLIKSENQILLRKANDFQTLSSIFVNKESKLVENIKNIKYDVVGITACPTGIAHTYMAQEKLEEYAKELNLSVKIETQGRRGTENKLTKDEIQNAKVIILAHDKAISGMDRFNGVELIDTHTKEAIFKGKELIQNFDSNQNKVKINVKETNEESSNDDFGLKKFKDIKGNLLAGVSKMLPFVVAGGIILGIGFLLDIGTSGSDGLFGTHREIARWFAAIGKMSMSMMVPILAAYIAYAIAGPQGLMPGLVGGLFASSIMPFSYASDGNWSNMWGNLIPNIPHTDSGFLGGIVAGMLAALFVMLLTRWFSKFPKGVHGVRDIVIIPVASLLLIAGSMFILNIPLGYTMEGISKGISKLANLKLLPLVAAVIGIMMCVDMGGPINKIAYSLGVLSVGNGLVTDKTSLVYNDQTIIMAAAMFAGMLPPIMIAMSTLMFRSSWSDKDRDAAKVNWLMGMFFITEGAIPFMIKDMKRVMLSSMFGGLIVGFFVGFFGIKIGAPHGGVLTFPLISLCSNGLVNLEINSQGAKIGVGITLTLIIVFGASMIGATMLGLWRKYDIKNMILKKEN